MATGLIDTIYGLGCLSLAVLRELLPDRSDILPEVLIHAPATLTDDNLEILY